MVGNSGSVSRPFVRRKQIGETGLAGTDISGRHPSIDAHRGGGGATPASKPPGTILPSGLFPLAMLFSDSLEAIRLVYGL